MNSLVRALLKTQTRKGENRSQPISFRLHKLAAEAIPGENTAVRHVILLLKVSFIIKTLLKVLLYSFFWERHARRLFQLLIQNPQVTCL